MTVLHGVFAFTVGFVVTFLVRWAIYLISGE